MRKPLAIIIPVLIAASAAVASPAQARESAHQSLRETLDLCGSGVAVEAVEEVDLHWISRKVGGSNDVYSFTFWSEGVVTWTNLDTDRRVTMTYSKVDRDVTVSDNGDGTRTIHALNNRIEKYVGPDGQIVMNRGPIWLDVVVADGATPADPFDDYWVDFLGWRQGGNWDMGDSWCDQMVAWLA